MRVLVGSKAMLLGVGKVRITGSLVHV